MPMRPHSRSLIATGSFNAALTVNSCRNYISVVPVSMSVGSFSGADPGGYVAVRITVHKQSLNG